MSIAHLARQVPVSRTIQRLKLYQAADRHFSTAIARSPSSGFARYEFAQMLIDRARSLENSLRADGTTAFRLSDCLRFHADATRAIFHLETCMLLWKANPLLSARCQVALLACLADHWRWTSRSCIAESDVQIRSCLETITRTLANPVALSTTTISKKALIVYLNGLTTFLLSFCQQLVCNDTLANPEIVMDALDVCAIACKRMETLGPRDDFDTIRPRACFVLARLALAASLPDANAQSSILSELRAGIQHDERVGTYVHAFCEHRDDLLLCYYAVFEVQNSNSKSRQELNLMGSLLSAATLSSGLSRFSVSRLKCTANVIVDFRALALVDQPVTSLLREIDFSSSPQLNFATTHRVSKKAMSLHLPKLHRLILSGCSSLDDESVLAIGEFAPALRELVLDECTKLIHPDFGLCLKLRTMSLRNCVQLKRLKLGPMDRLRELDLSGCCALEDSALDTALGSDLNCIELSKLSLVGCLSLSDSTLARIVKGNSLKSLCLGECSISVTAIKSIAQVGIFGRAGMSLSETLGVRRPDCKLSAVCLNRCEDHSLLQTLQKYVAHAAMKTMDHVKRLSMIGQEGPCPLSLWPRLTELDLSECPSPIPLLVDRPLSGSERLLRKASRDSVRPSTSAVSNSELSLKSLILSRSAQLLPPALSLVLPSLPALELLELSSCVTLTDDVVVTIADSCRRLKKLDLFGCYAISNRGLTAIGESCTMLEVLSAGGCRNVSDGGIVAVLKGCPLLKTLDVAATQVGAGLAHYMLTASTSAESSTSALEVLHFSQCTQVTAANILAVASFCPKLRELYVFMVRSLSNTALRACFESLKFLEVIDASGCKDITDAAFVEARWLPRFRSVNLLGNSAITDTTIRRILVSSNSSLETLNLRNCTGISSDGLRAIVLHARVLRLLNIKEARGDGWGTGQRHLHRLEMYKPLLKIIDA